MQAQGIDDRRADDDYRDIEFAAAPTVRWDSPPVMVEADSEGRMEAPVDTTVVAALREHAPFAQLSTDELKRLAPLFRWEEYAPGTALADAGETSRTIMVVCSGTVEVVSGEGVKRTVGSIVRKGRVSESRFVKGTPSSGTVRTATRVLVLIAEFDRLVEFEGPATVLQMELLSALSRSLSEPSGLDAMRLLEPQGESGSGSPALTVVLAGVMAHYLL